MHKFEKCVLILDESRSRPDGGGSFDITPTILDLLDIDVAEEGFDGDTLPYSRSDA